MSDALLSNQAKGRIPGPISGTSVSEGYFLLLAPLGVGVHTIHFTATADLQDLFGPGAFYVTDTNYVVTVAPKKP